MNVTIIQAPTDLGLRPTGVDGLGDALLALGLAEQLGATIAAHVVAPPHAPGRDSATGLLNSTALADHARRLADAVVAVLEHAAFPLVLGGDDSVLLGNLLALRRYGELRATRAGPRRYGLAFLDAHGDFREPRDSRTGEASDSDLWLATGRGPATLSDLEGLGPLVRDIDVVVVGYRDEEEKRDGSLAALRATEITTVSLAEVRAAGIDAAAERALEALRGASTAGFWIHLDADVLDDAVMPAVDYRLPGGLSADELIRLLRHLLSSGAAVGMDVTIYNPALDPERKAGRALAAVLSDALAAV